MWYDEPNWYDPKDKLPNEGELVLCWYRKPGTVWAGRWNKNIACTKWMYIQLPETKE